mmetsp:Transcript_51255/g.166181  ORF Transcript_51255/g.166181 Transcript_51255/m.166181 type:complete len:202 (+) Transcript_51255:259-864(+)
MVSPKAWGSLDARLEILGLGLALLGQEGGELDLVALAVALLLIAVQENVCMTLCGEVLAGDEAVPFALVEALDGARELAQHAAGLIDLVVALEGAALAAALVAPSAAHAAHHGLHHHHLHHVIAAAPALAAPALALATALGRGRLGDRAAGCQDRLAAGAGGGASSAGAPLAGGAAGAGALLLHVPATHRCADNVKTCTQN